MVCIYCGNKTKVSNSRTSKNSHSTWRRRECSNCHSIFTTREHVDLSAALRVKNSKNDLQPFSRDKLLISVHESLSHRKTPLRDASELTDTIITKFSKLHVNGVLETRTITAVTLQALERFDNAASVHYRAHHSKWIVN